MVGLTKNAAAEYGPEGLRINAVGPGYIRTPLLDALPTEALDDLAGRHVLGRLGRPDEVAPLVRFLLSDEASCITGGYYLVDGRYTSVKVRARSSPTTTCRPTPRSPRGRSGSRG